MLLEVLADTLLDCIKMLPFLLAAFFILELLEHYSGCPMRISNASSEVAKNTESNVPMVMTPPE